MGTHRETQRHRDAFEVWWEASRSCDSVVKALGVHANSVTLWREWFGWDARADKRDVAVKAKQDRDAVSRRLKMQEAHRKAGEALRTRGVQYIVRNEITTAREATQAIKVGVEIERTTEGLPTVLIEILNASPDELQQQLDAIERGLAEAEGPDPGDDAGAGDTPEDLGEPEASG